MNRKELTRQYRLAAYYANLSNDPEDLQKARERLAELGRHVRQTKKVAATQQLSLFP